jgi:hypothetical protein
MELILLKFSIFKLFLTKYHHTIPIAFKTTYTGSAQIQIQQQIPKTTPPPSFVAGSIGETE